MEPGIARAVLRAGFFVASLAPGVALAQSDVPLAVDTAAMAPGTYVWNPPAAAPGPVSIVVSVPDQRAYVYQGQVLVAVSTASTGKQGHETPVGSFTILQKTVKHRSNQYEDAPMPYMQRLTWDGIAIHAGAVKGIPASHGCVRLPLAFAKKLYALTRLGAQVQITDMPVAANVAPEDAVPPPDDPTSGDVTLAAVQ